MIQKLSRIGIITISCRSYKIKGNIVIIVLIEGNIVIIVLIELQWLNIVIIDLQWPEQAGTMQISSSQR